MCFIGDWISFELIKGDSWALVELWHIQDNFHDGQRNAAMTFLLEKLPKQLSD